MWKLKYNPNQNLNENSILSINSPKPKSIASVGSEHYKTSIPIDQHFNWFQKLMWKWCFGIKVEDYSKE